VDGIESLGLPPGDGLLFESDEAKPGFIDFAENGAGVAVADRVGLYDAKGTLQQRGWLLGELCLHFIVMGAGLRS
jgi:hypothetical protein